MFDQLVESNTAETEFKPRRKFFLVSSVIVGILFVTAVVASIYAADYNLGTDNFDIAELLAPVAQTEPIDEPEPPRQQPRSDQNSSSDIATRQFAMASTSDYSKIPNGISTDVNPYRSIPSGKFIITPGPEQDASSQVNSTVSTIGNSSSGPQRIDEVDDAANTPPPASPKIERKPIAMSSGVISGKATHLPKPIYSAAAIAVGAKGAVNVQITIDEQGNVISAKAVSGNPLLRPEAEKAAWKAKFSQTKLSGVPVKVTGVIVYNFTRN